MVDFRIEKPPYFDIRKKAAYFKSHFQPLQIFKSDLFKQQYMHLLKCDEVDFYETEFSYTTPMLESIKFKIQSIPQILFKVKKRMYTRLEEKQSSTLRHYYTKQPMLNNILHPILYDSLENVAFRKNAPPKLPKKVHQIWFSEQEISPIRMRLHQTFKDVNPSYEVNLWTPENITETTFPLTYSLLYTAVEHEKYDSVSYKAAIGDFARIEVLYQFGGFYFDFKVESLRPLDPFRKY